MPDPTPNATAAPAATPKKHPLLSAFDFLFHHAKVQNPELAKQAQAHMDELNQLAKTDPDLETPETPAAKPAA